MTNDKTNDAAISDSLKEIGHLFGSRPGRDPARIEVIMKSLQAAWMANPDLRFHQLLAAIQPAKIGVDQFYEEDHQILADINAFNPNVAKTSPC